MKDKTFTFNSGKAKEFFLEKLSFEMSPKELEENIRNNIEEINIVDVRAYDDYIDGHIPFAIHVPLNNLDEHLVMLEKDKVNIVYSYCPFCKLAQKAGFMMAEKGYPVMIMCGGYRIWKDYGFDTIKTSSDD